MESEIILTKEQIEEITDRISGELNERYENQKTIPVFICVLKGACPFFMDLMKKCKFELKMDFVQVQSYSGKSSTGVIHMKKDVSENIKNKEVYLVEDIIDSGCTLSYLKQYIESKFQPESCNIICLVDKTPMRKVDLKADLVGLCLNENKFLCGYGFDYYEITRNTDYVFVPTEEQIAEWDRLLEEDKND